MASSISSLRNPNSGGSIPIGDVVGATATTSFNTVTLTWTDPEDVVVSGVTLAKWGGTQVVRKAGSAPTSREDGDTVVNITTRNQYASTGYQDTGLEYGVVYYYRFFPYTDSYKYTDGSSVSAQPTRIVISVVPTQNGTLTYTGSQQTAAFNNFDPTKLSVTDNTGTDAGSYIAYFTPLDGYCWSDSTITAKPVSWSILKATLTKPEQSGTLTYNGNSQTATWDSNYDSTKMSVSGDTGTDAGSYTATFSLQDTSNYEWAGGTTADKTSTWTINRATGSVTVNPTSVSLNTSTLYADVTITQVGDGALSVSSSAPSIATVSAISNNTFRITGVETGTCTVTVSAAQSTNYTAATATVDVTATFVSRVLNDNSWSVISNISTAGTASNYWSVGDTKQITLNGTVGTKTYTNKNLWVYILGFDHNAEVEGYGISFGCFKTVQTNGIDICLNDSQYPSNSYDGTKYFNMNHWGANSTPYNTNYGGWKGCDLRYDILGSTDTAPSGYGARPTTSRVGYDASSTTATNPVSGTLMAALPSDLRAVMKPITKYTDNYGNSSNVAEHVTTSVDYLPLLAEYEVQGSRSYANQYEQNHQNRYSYYANGNSKIKYRESVLSEAAYWWVRSAYYSLASIFCAVGTDGSASGNSSRNGIGLAPAFLI